MSLCLASAGVVKSLSVAAFMLAWTHSIEKIEWQEDWRVTPQGLEIVEARVKGSGAGMEPPPEARLSGGWFHWHPQLVPLAEVALGNSGLAGEWRICGDGTCRTMSDLLGRPAGTNVTVMRACDLPATEHLGANDTVPADPVRAFIADARARLAASDLEGAVEVSNKAVTLAPGNADVFEVRGDVRVGVRRYDSAIDDYDAAIRLTPDVARLFSKRAAAFGLMHQHRLAVRDYSEAVRLDRSVATLVARAGAYKKVRRSDLAIDDETEAIRLDPAAAELYDARGQSYAHNAAYDRAIADYDVAIRLRPSAPFYLHRGMAYHLKGDLDRAVADYNQALARDGGLALAYNNRGMAYREKGERPRALADFTHAVRLDPTLEIALEHRKSLAREIEQLGARMPLSQKSATK